MNNKRFITATATLGLIGALSAAPARADVSWEHSGTIRVSTLPVPLVKFKLYSNFTPERKRALLKYSSTMMPPIPLPESAQAQLPPQLRIKRITGHGDIGMVYRHDDDRVVMWESQTKAFIDEPFKATMTKLAPNPWTKLDPKLAEQPVPELTDEQRERLGAEVRAAFSPLTKRFSRSYFRALPERRTFKGIEGKGYRLTQLINVDGFKKGSGQWMKVSCEWWLAGQLPGDNIIRDLQARTLEEMKANGWPSHSMWQNESGFVMLHALPTAYMDALKTVAPAESLSEASFGGTPLRMDITVTPPPSAGLMNGDVRASLELTDHNTYPLGDSVFSAPADYKKVDTAPFWKQLDKMRAESSWDKIFEAMESYGAY